MFGFGTGRAAEKYASRIGEANRKIQHVLRHDAFKKRASNEQ